MTTITDIDQLSLPEIYNETILHMVSKIREFPVVKGVILFGSCARQNVSEYSDIDLALVVPEPLSIEEEWNIDSLIRNWDTNLACDVIFVPENVFDKEIKGDTVIRAIVNEGVRLDGLLYQRV